MAKYKFNKEEHLHQLLKDGEWRALTGCTTVLKVLAKPALIQWAANEAVKYIQENTNKCEKGVLDDYEYYLVTEQDLDKAKTAHRRKKEKAGDWGTELHAEVERYIKNSIEGKKGKYKDTIKKFIEWVKSNKVEFLESEKHVYSEGLWLGGVVDFICKIDGKIWIGDIKTSKSGIYPENFWQCAGYDLMLKDMGLYPKVAGYLILNIKEDGSFLEKRSISNGDNMKAFMACLDIYRIQEKIKNQVI